MLSRYQRGFVHQRGKSKVWYGFYREDVRTPDGKTKRYPRQIRLGTVAELPTKAAARKKLAELMPTTTDTSLATDITFGELVEKWRAAEGPTKKESTFDKYSFALEKYVVPVFGERKIMHINRADIQTFLNDQAKTYSKSSLRMMRVVLGLTMGWAESCGWIVKSPCVRIKLPQETGGRRVKRVALTAEQVAAIAKRLKEPYATLLLLLYCTGLRISEAAALRWTDLEGNVLYVSQRIYERKIGTVKSERSKRKLVLDAGMVARINALRCRFKSEWMFQSKSKAGTPIDPRNA